MATPTTGTLELKQDSLQQNLTQQCKLEINGAELKNPEKFMLDQKYGITDPVLTKEEKQLIEQEEHLAL